MNDVNWRTSTAGNTTVIIMQQRKSSLTSLGNSRLRSKLVGGICDDRFLVKPVKSSIAYMPNAKYELPYDGAKEMLLVDDVDNKEFLTDLFNSMYDELLAPKPKKKK